MHSLEHSGVALILWLQSIRTPVLDALALSASALGNEPVYMLLIPLLYWCVDRTLGVRLLLFVISSTWLSAIFKWTLALPRPYWVAPEIHPLSVASEFGAPSGHAQNALGVWMFLAALLERRFGVRSPYFVSAGVALTTSCSRVYMGVHFAHDVLLGWVLALVMLFAFSRLEGPVSRITQAGSDARRTLGLTLFAALITGTLTALAWSGQRAIEPSWQQNAAAAHAALGRPGPIDPYNLGAVVGGVAALLAVGIALPLVWRYASFDPAGPFAKRLSCYLLGLLGLFALYAGLTTLLPKPAAPAYLVGRFVRYAAIVLWAFAGAPWLFLRLGLAAPGFSHEVHHIQPSHPNLAKLA